MSSNLPKVLVTFSFLFLIVLLFATVPYARAATAEHVVLSEVSIGGTPGEFVELYNPTETDINLASWKLTKKTSGGAEATLSASLTGVIKSHGYFLITPQTGYTGTASADQTYTNSSNSIASNNTVLLYDNNGTTVIDKVGFGSATDKEGTSETTPANNTSRERRANSSSTPTSMAAGGTDEFMGNGEDTDNNANDFVSRSMPQPQNSHSALEPVPTATPTETPTPTPIESGPTQTPTETPTPTSTETPTITPTPTEIPTQTPTPTTVPSEEPTSTPTQTPTPTPIQNPTATPTITSTPTPIESGPTETPVITSTSTPTPTGVVPTLTPRPTIGIPFPQIPKFQLVCKTNYLDFQILFLRFHIPMVTCNLIKL